MNKKNNLDDKIKNLEYPRSWLNKRGKEILDILAIHQTGNKTTEIELLKSDNSSKKIGKSFVMYKNLKAAIMNFEPLTDKVYVMNK